MSERKRSDRWFELANELKRWTAVMMVTKNRNGSFLYTCRCFVLFFLTLSFLSSNPFFSPCFRIFFLSQYRFFLLTTCVIFLRQMIGSHIGFRKWMFCREEVKRRDSFFVSSFSCKCLKVYCTLSFLCERWNEKMREGIEVMQWVRMRKKMQILLAEWVTRVSVTLKVNRKSFSFKRSSFYKLPTLPTWRWG